MLAGFVKLILKFFQSRKQILLENALLRLQLVIYQRSVKRPKIQPRDRILLVWLSSIFSGWKKALVVVRPETVVGWHRQGFRLYWKWKSRRAGRPCIDWPLIKLIRRMRKENPTWSAQRIQGELAKLGLTVSDNTVLKYLGKPKPDADKRQRWRTFLKNHAKHTVGIDFLVVRTIFFKAIYVFVAISHDRRKILHWAVTDRPHSEWAIQQLRQIFDFDTTTTYVIRDNDAIFSEEFKQTITRFGLQDTPTAQHSPWQNPFAERVIGTLRRECLDHIIVLNERHLRSVLTEYIDNYYNVARTHMSLNKDSPVSRPVQAEGKIVGTPILGGLHHIYTRVA
ncbi:MAG: transposase family protein [Smithella sp.]|nr:transposase family protein [Smithella sp.]